jgi:hypothetical protein
VEGVVEVINDESGKKRNTGHYRHSFAIKICTILWLSLSV